MNSTRQASARADDRELTRLLEARLHDPFQVLGPHSDGSRMRVRVFNPHARSITMLPGELVLTPMGTTGLFEWSGAGNKLPSPYRLRWIDDTGNAHEQHDPYAFPPLLQNRDLELFSQGRHHAAYSFLGAHFLELQ
ncbi:MAG TPA: 1,4-alpha-glucan branching enzyme, partial [Gammaproteobacteria bacterium]